MPIDKDIFKFFSDVSEGFSSSETDLENEIFLNNELFNQNECYYIFNLQTNELVEYKGFDKLLGYNDENIDLEFIYNLYLPEEKEILDRITKSVVSYCLSKPRICEEALLQTSFSIRKSNGDYIKVVSHAKSFSSNEDGYLTHFIVKLTDVTFLDSSQYVSCLFSAKDLDQDSFRKQVYSTYLDFFTDREVEIIKEINNGLTNSEIADKLFISKHTVVTHRKNILKKANVNNTEALILFCKERGIV